MQLLAVRPLGQLTKFDHAEMAARKHTPVTTTTTTTNADTAPKLSPMYDVIDWALADGSNKFSRESLCVLCDACVRS
jgi:hypothetical protein